jgi:hypothetical protein
VRVPAKLGCMPTAVATIKPRVDDRGRILLPSKILTQWSPTGVPAVALAILMYPGLITFHVWQTVGHLVEEKRKNLSVRAAYEPSVLAILKALEDRYKRFQIPSDGRPTLTSEMIAHLGITPPADVYVWRVQDVVELTSVEYRLEQLRLDYEELQDLPR